MGATNMKYYRYGKFRFMDYLQSWVSIVLLFAFAVAEVLLKVPVWFSIFPLLYAVIWLWRIVSPNLEKFVLCEDYVLVVKGKKTRKVMLPNEVTIIVSPVDICPPLSVRTADGNQTHILKDKYAISILIKMPLADVLECLHGGHLKKYTTSTIKNAFEEYCYSYSFVCEQDLLEAVMQKRKCLVVIPESLTGKVFINSEYADVYVDGEC